MGESAVSSAPCHITVFPPSFQLKLGLWSFILGLPQIEIFGIE